MQAVDGDPLPPLAPAVPPVVPPVVPESSPVELEAVGPRYIWLMVLAQAGVFVAFITPLAISLSIRLDQLAPGREEYLGFITGAGAGVVVLAGPTFGVLSDRTRTRLGRRRPFMIGGTILGVVSLVVMATAPSVVLLGAGWVLAQLGWGMALGMLQTSQADRLPESQRGRVAGLVGFGTQVAPVVGVGLASLVSADNLLLFLVPGAVGVVAVTLFVVLVHEDDSRGRALPDRLGAAAMLRKFLWSPRRYPDYSWNWLGRFLFYFGLTLNTTFTAFFFAERLDTTVSEVAGTLTLLALGSIVATTAGALGGGFLSDRWRRRRGFVLASGVLFGGGAVVMALAPSLPVLVTGSLMTAAAIGMFAAVDQALLLDILPERGTEAGRFMSIMGFAVSIPQATAPLIAPVLLALGAAGGGKNYPLLYLVAALCTLLGGVAVMRVRSVR